MKIYAFCVSSLPQETNDDMKIRSQEQPVSPDEVSSSITLGSSKGPQRSDMKKIVFRITELLLLGMSAQNQFLFFDELLTGFVLIELLLLFQTFKHKNKANHGTILKPIR